MATSLSSFGGMPRLIPKRNLRILLQARAQSSSADEGKSSISIVDANIGLLKERIAKLRMENRLDRCRLGVGDGWNYQSGYASKLIKRGDKLLAESLEVAELVVGTVGLTILGCTFCLCFLSFVVHLV